MKNVDIPLEQLKTDFLTQMEDCNYSYDAIRTYRHPLRKFIQYLHNENIVEIQNVSEEDIEQYRLYLIDQRYKSATVDIYLRSIKLFFKHLESESIIFINPTTDLILPKPNRTLQYIPTENEMDKFLNFNTDTNERLRNRALFELAYSCGGRLNELRMINLKDLDLLNGEVKLLGKGNVERLVPIGKTAIHWLNKYINESRINMLKDKNEEALFIARRGNRISKTGIQKQIAYTRKITDTTVSTHGIRRAFATHLLDGGASPFVIQKLLGHSSLTHLSQYLSVSITELKKTHKDSAVGK